MSRYLHAMHDPGGENLMADKPGWIVISEAIGSDPQDHSSQDYTSLSSRGFSVIVRLNNAHNGVDGTYPAQEKYADFAERCANFCKNLRGVKTVIVGNEPNHLQERPHGQLITPQMASDCFNRCYEAIKGANPEIDVLTPAIAPWDNTTVYSGNTSGDWLVYMSQLLKGVHACDGFAIHAYTHGSDPKLIRDLTTVHGWYWHFPVFTQQLSVIPPAMRHLPAYITETNQGDGGWADTNSGWVREAYKYVDEWNRQPNTQKVVALAMYRWQKHGGQEKWCIEARRQLQEDFKLAVAAGYPVGTAYGAAGDNNVVYIPSIKGEGEMSEALPARQVDERAAKKGIRIEVPALKPGQKFWRANRIYAPDEQETRALGPDHHLLANVLVDGQRLIGATLLVQWGSGGPNERRMIHTKENGNFAWTADMGLSPGDFKVNVVDAHPSETVTGIKMGWWDNQGRWNPGAHTSVLIDFHLVTQSQAVTPPTPPDMQDADWDESWFDEPRQGVIAISMLNIRSGPGTDFPVVGSKLFGTEFTAGFWVARKGYTWLNIGQNQWIAQEYVSWDKDIVNPPSNPDTNWERAWPIVLKIEGGLSLDPNDSGNWYKGKLVGTKYGISAAVWGGQYDIPNLTKAQALDIYKTHYWLKAGCDKLPWPLCLVVFDTAVNHGVGVAVSLLNKTPTREEAYLGLRALRYFEDPNWRHFGIAWGNRIEHLDDIIDGEIAS